MAKLVIGGEELEGHLNTFDRLEKAWPLIEKVSDLQATTPSPADLRAMGMKGVGVMMPVLSAIIEVAAVALGRPVAEVKAEITFPEMGGLQGFFADLMREASVTRPPEPALPQA